MSQNNIIKLAQPEEFSDALTAVLRQRARSLLTQAVEAEIASFLETHADKLTEDGHRRRVRHGHLPEREIATGIGLVSVREPRVRDRGLQREGRIRFSPSILPPYARHSKSLDVLIPLLHLKGISTGDFAEALAALVGSDAGGLSASTITWFERGLDRRTCALARTRSLGQALCLPLGPRHSREGQTGRRSAMHPRHHRSDIGRQCP